MKNYVYREPVNSLEQLDDRLHEALATITPQMIQGAQASLIRRTRLCIQIGGGHFELYYGFRLFIKLFFNFKKTLHFCFALLKNQLLLRYYSSQT
jgi:hypothetical protein